MGLTGFNRQRRAQLVAQVGKEAAQKLISKGIDDVEKLSRIDEVCNVLGLSEEDRKEVKKLAKVEESDPEADNDFDSLPDDTEFPYHYGGGNYFLSNGETVRGKANAKEAESELEG